MTNISGTGVVHMFQNLKLYLTIRDQEISIGCRLSLFAYCMVVIVSYDTSNPQHFQRKDIALAYVPKQHVYFCFDIAVIFTPSDNKTIK